MFDCYCGRILYLRPKFPADWTKRCRVTVKQESLANAKVSA